MNRRDFFKTIGVASVVAALPIQLPKAFNKIVTPKITPWTFPEGIGFRGDWILTDWSAKALFADVYTYNMTYVSKGQIEITRDWRDTELFSVRISDILTLAEFNVTRKIDNIYLNTGSDMWSEQRHIIPLPSTYTLELEGYSNEFLGPEAFGRDM